jgi:hypothetical protein
VLAVEVHQINSSSSDIVFGLAADVIEVRREMYTPGYANSVRATLEPFPALFLNEVLANNLTGIQDAAGDRDPWVELLNLESTPCSLDGYSLAIGFVNLRQWTFPVGSSIAGGAYQVVWGDGEPGETTGSEWHTSFRLASPSGVVVLSRLQNGQPVVVDYLEYAGLAADQSFGFLEEERFGTSSMILPEPTPGIPNDSGTGPIVPWLLPISFGTGGETVVTWSAIPGRSYRLECKSELAEAIWMVVGEKTAEATTMSLADAESVGKTHRFYRVVLLP